MIAIAMSKLEAYVLQFYTFDFVQRLCNVKFEKCIFLIFHKYPKEMTIAFERIIRENIIRENVIRSRPKLARS